MSASATVFRVLLRLQPTRVERRIAERFDAELSRTLGALIIDEEALRA